MSEPLQPTDAPVLEVEATATELPIMPPGRKARRPRAVNRRCAATTKAGTPCPVRPMTAAAGPPGTPLYCLQHAAKLSGDTALAERVHASRVQGGHAAQVAIRQLDIPEADFTSDDAPTAMKKLLASVADNVLRGRVTSSQVAAVSQLVNSALKIQEAMNLVVLDQLRDEIEAKLGRRS